MAWTNQENNAGTDVKLLVYMTGDQGERAQTYWAFRGEEIKGTAIAGLRKRILNGKVFGKYKTAIFYNQGVEVERWKEGIKTS